ncbi:FAD/FMN-containing dehydrogenase [Actinoplanes campanulatus]|uniref:FAD/FMN-containing dehydrogenase n=1 Tax=Actinoplanes campanulatus TaxID=113559 RepID=A0A7W5FJE1_9ACTN|nr:FAD-binding oxidoreductase [Actinoplanes campanulatus]MBB3100688.1 FAD/FMN-containing dehydrogenase [Actinoplanes campanulatus]GGN45478.1 FAD-binding protein [Actinoplanes campanulatus]GID41148.1 FAD-binding protein [Actinoplanes campanulatus]
MKVTRRQVLTHGVTAAGALALGSAATLSATRWAGLGAIPATSAPGALLDDASRINPTAVRGVLFADPTPERTARTVTPLLRRIATGEDPAMAVAGVRHSMGGQSMLAGGWVLDTRPMNRIDLDRAAGVVRVGAGATWRDLIPVLNEAGFSPTVMQSNHDFSIGGSLSVNCHGWHASHPPIASTVRRLLLLTAEGDVLTCSPTENAELFGLVLGGYGMFGVILEADLEVWPNAIYEPHFVSVPTSEYAARFAAGTSEMAYGRLSVDPLSFLEEAILVRFTPKAGTVGTVLPLTRPSAPELQRAIFRGSAGSDVGKTLRWSLEREAAPWLAAPMSRNTIQNEPAAVFADRSEETSDILHEYFVPRQRLWDFVQTARDVIAASPMELLNVTVRDVRADTRSALAYAREDVFGLVMSFRQERTARADDRMRELTRTLIDAAAAVGGTFYLPYRLHATAGQVRRAYPGWDAAMATKRRLDPKPVFRNGLYEAYGR